MISFAKLLQVRSESQDTESLIMQYRKILGNYSMQGERWREDPRFAAPMAILENGDVFLHDCVYLHHPIGVVMAIVCHFFQRVYINN